MSKKRKASSVRAPIRILRSLFTLARRVFVSKARRVSGYLRFNSRLYSLGAKGERAATEYLKKNYFNIWERNFKSYHGEIDIIASQGRELVFFEVKTRRQRVAEKFPGIAAVDEVKLERIRNVARFYIQEASSKLKITRIIKAKIALINVIQHEGVISTFRFENVYLESID